MKLRLGSLRFSYILIFCIFAVPIGIPTNQSLAQNGSWSTKQSIITPRVAAASGVIDGKLYVVGGSPPTGFATTANQAYDPLTDTWTTRAPALISRSSADAAAIGSKLYVVGGLINGEFRTNELEVYDAATDSWTVKAPDPTTRFTSAVAAIDGKLYVVGGVTDFSVPNLTTLEVYDPATDTWTTKAPMPTRREGLGAAVIDGKLYAVGGFVRPENVFTGALEVYDPSTDTWTSKAPMPTTRAFLGVAVINGELHVVGGGNNPNLLATHEVYDPATDTWTTSDPMPTAREFLAAEAINASLYTLGGYANCTPTSGCETSGVLEVYTAATGCSGQISTGSASALIGPSICKPGFVQPQCTAAPFDTGQDLAFSGNGFARAAVALDLIPQYDSIHQPEFANDGYYGNGASWIGNSPGSWMKIDLGRSVQINQINFGRDRMGGYDDRDPGQFKIEVAQSDNVYANGDDSNDATEYTTVFDSAVCGFEGVIAGSQTLSVNFTPLVSRFVKLTFSNMGAAVDEVQVFGNPQTCLTPPSGLVAWWDGDAVSGSTAQDIVGTDDGSMLGGASVIPGIVGNAFALNGSTGRVEMGNPPNLNFGTTGPFSLEAWFFWDGGGSLINNIIRKSNYPVSSPSVGYWLRIGQGNQMLEFFAGSFAGDQTLPQGLITTPVTPGTWHNVVGTRDSVGTMRLYLDGEFRGAIDAPGADTTSDAPFVLGAWNDRFGLIELFSGLIDEVSVYNRALDESEVQGILAAGSLGKCKTHINRPPNVVCANVTVSGGPNCTANASIDNDSGDPDGDPITITQSPPGPYALGTTVVTLNVSDNHGASSSCSATVTVVDNTPPAISCPADIVIDNSNVPGQCSAVISYNVSATDNCSSVALSCSPSSGSVFPQGTTTVTCNAGDASGNTATCSFAVTVIPPKLTALNPAAVWIGLKNSDDVGTKFDLRGEVFKNGSLIGSGEAYDVPGGGAGFNNAVLRMISLSASTTVAVCSGDMLTFRLSVRIAASSGHRAGTARLWFNDSSANSRFGATIGGQTNNYYLGIGSLLNLTPGAGPRSSIDVFVDRAAGGNPFKPFGTWNLTL